VSAHPSSTRLSVDYFDGHSARAHRVSMWLEGDMLQLHGHDVIRQVPLPKVQWPERTRHGLRLAHFSDGGSVQALDATAWDTWARLHQIGEPLVVRAQQSWRWTVLATVVLLLVAVMGYGWGLPLAARALAPLIPTSVDRQIGQAALQAMDQEWLQPSKVPAEAQARLRRQFEAAAERLQASEQARPAKLPLQLHFRQARIGPNAFALPDGSIVVTDELLNTLQGRDDVVLGVIGHEMGHVTQRHGLRALIQTGVLSAATGVVLGDFSTVLAGAPALLGHLAYSRDLEREADDTAIAFLRANHIRPSVMVTLFERLAAYQRKAQGQAASGSSASNPRGEDSTLGIALSSHPADEERMAHFKAADLGPDAQP
jgi:Zn-dependent protease with chaperone function